MSEGDGVRGPAVFNRWLKATTLGWLLGFVLIVIFAIAWDQVGGGAQFIVGLGMGAGVGFTQARVVEELVGRSRRWILSTAAGMGLPFLLWDLSAVLGSDALFSLPLCVVAGSLLVGVLQARLLRAVYHHPIWWIPASLVGWGLPVAAIAIGDSSIVFGTGALLSVLAMFFGGVVLGAVTGKALISMPLRSAV